MESEGDLIRVYKILTLPVVKQGGTLYFKVYKDLADRMGIAEGDTYTLGVIGKEIGKVAPKK